MNCCKNHNAQEHGPKKRNGHLKHIFMMALCCGAPVLLILLIPLIGSVIPGSENVLRIITPFLCPILMLGMIPMMVKEWKGTPAGEKKAMQTEEEKLNETNRHIDSGNCH